MFEGTPIAHPNYAGLILPNTGDVGIVILTEEPSDVGFSALPPISSAHAQTDNFWTNAGSVQLSAPSISGSL